MRKPGSWFEMELEQRGVSRREFVEFCGVMATALALPKVLGARIAEAVLKAEKPVIVWLEFQDCAGNTESFLRATKPTVADIVLDVLSVDYHETIMAAAGHQAEDVLAKTVKEKKGAYLAVVEGSIPTGVNGAYCTIGGRSALQIAREVCGGAAATIAVGTCATFGGLPAAAPNPTGALGVADAVPGLKNLVNLSACPMNPENLTALVVHYLTFKDLPALDGYRRPLFAYGKSIHDNCERRAHFDAGQYVEAWGDDGHRTGYCLYKMGCKGPVTFQNCPVVRWNEGTNWPIGCGHPVHRLRRARLLGQDDAVLPPPAHDSRLRARDSRRQDRTLGLGRRGGGLRHPRRHLPRPARPRRTRQGGAHPAAAP